jgi:hypothetical protein
LLTAPKSFGSPSEAEAPAVPPGLFAIEAFAAKVDTTFAVRKRDNSTTTGNIRVPS